jgi:hypothetical protein
MPAAMSRATLGVRMADQGVASATANTSQQVDGSISTALLNTLTTGAATRHAQTYRARPLVKLNATLTAAPPRCRSAARQTGLHTRFSTCTWPESWVMSRRRRVRQGAHGDAPATAAGARPAGGVCAGLR